ncbi:MAG: hypothetical protein V4550_17070 [Gemmatimonadota bacterium]
MTNGSIARRRAVAVLALALAAGASCGSPKKLVLRQSTKSYSFVISSDPVPPTARDPVIYTITVKDRETGQPVETGEGRIFANTVDGARTYDGFSKAPQVGVYSAKLSFVTAGQWAIGIQFHSDSTKPLEKTEWMQDVLAERPTP